MKNVIAFIGFGEAAYHIANGLKSEGLTAMVAYDVNQKDPQKGKNIRKRAEEAEIKLADSLKDAFESSDFIISLTSAKNSMDIANEIIPYLVSGQVYVDMNSAAPTVKRQISEIEHQQDVYICDAAIMNTVPGNGHKVEILLSGDGAQKFNDQMMPYHMNMTNLNTQAGGASAIKMFKSVIMKGLPQLMIEAMVPAEKFGVLDALISSLNKSLYGKKIEQLADTFIARTIVHAERRSEEMQDAIMTIEEMGLDASMSKSTEKKLEQLMKLNILEQIGVEGNMDYRSAIKILCEEMEESHA